MMESISQHCNEKQTNFKTKNEYPRQQARGTSNLDIKMKKTSVKTSKASVGDEEKMLDESNTEEVIKCVYLPRNVTHQFIVCRSKISSDSWV